MTELQQKLALYNDLLETRTRSLLNRPSSYETLYAMMSYHLGWLDKQLQPCAADGGKRLRPALCFLACESVGAELECALPGAVALELLHNFSLVHDDIEDESRLRRHRSTVWDVWGIPHAINVGDGMFALAHLVLTEEVSDPEDALKAARMLDRTSIELCEGQFLDMRYEDAERVSLAEYLTMIRGKTAAMFACAVEMGALLGGATAVTVSRLGRFGRVLGEAFQMQDDILGVWGDPDTTGKAPSDIRSRKRALPAVLAWERAKGDDLITLSALYARSGPLDDADVEWVRYLFDRLGIAVQAKLMADERYALADRLLEEALPSASIRTPLRMFIDQIAARHARQTGHIVQPLRGAPAGR